MIFLIIGSEQAGGSISKIPPPSQQSWWSYSEYQNIYIRNILTTTGRAYLADDDDWIIIVLEVTRQVSSYTNFEQFMRGLLKWKPKNIISTE